MERCYRLRKSLPIAIALCMMLVFSARSQHIDIEKATNGVDADTPPGPNLSVGDPITWTYVVTNTGAEELTNVIVTDDQLGTVSCPQTTLAPGESMTCTATGTATAGQYANVGAVTATTPSGRRPFDDDPSHYFGVSETPSIDIEKATNGQDADTPPGPGIIIGDPITWTYVVTNTGAEGLTNVIVTDDQLGLICGSQHLSPGSSFTCTATGTATAGQYANVGTANAVAASGAAVSDSDPSHYFGVSETPSIDIEKATNGQDADTPPGPNLSVGDPITWTYVVTNTGVGVLSSVAVTDDQLGLICSSGSLSPGSSFTCTATGTATAGQHANVGTAEATTDRGRTISDSDPSHYFGNQSPDCSGAVASPASLWPANHKFVSVDVLGVTDPDGDPVTITVGSIFQDEPVDTNGDGSFAPDGRGMGTSTAQVRAERKGQGNGRVYHISFIAEDGNGGTCSGEVLVGVPHDQGGQSTPVDDGALYDSTVPSGALKAGVGPSAATVPARYELSAAYPNPFNPTTTIRYMLPEANHVQVTVYDVLGQKVKALVNRYQEAGSYEVSFDATDLSSGTYLYVMEAGTFRQVRAMSLMK